MSKIKLYMSAFKPKKELKKCGWIFLGVIFALCVKGYVEYLASQLAVDEKTNYEKKGFLNLETHYLGNFTHGLIQEVNGNDNIYERPYLVVQPVFTDRKYKIILDNKYQDTCLITHKEAFVGTKKYFTRIVERDEGITDKLLYDEDYFSNMVETTCKVLKDAGQ